MIIKELLVTLSYIKTTGLACVAREHNSKCLSLRVILFCLTAGLTIFNSYTHWRVWITIQDSGLSHPLLRVPHQWTNAWLVFTSIGTASSALYIFNELSGVVAFYREYWGTKRETDPCFPCRGVGLNFVTRSEILTLLNISLEDLPLLVLSLLFAAAQYSCNHPTPLENISVLNVVFVSSLVSLLHVVWCMIRFVLYLILRAYSLRCVRAKPNTTHSTTTTTGVDSEAMKRKMKEKELELEILESTDSKFRSRQLYASKCCKMKCCIVCHTVILVVVCSLTIVISATAIALAKNQDILTKTFFLDPSKQLSVYRAFPREQIIVNASAIINSGTVGVCLQEEFNNAQPMKNNTNTISCNEVFIYNVKEGQIHFNYEEAKTEKDEGEMAEHNLSNSSSTVLESMEQCSKYYSELFLGYQTEGGEVKRFDETCLGVLILPGTNGALLQRQEDLPVNCNTSLLIP